MYSIVVHVVPSKRTMALFSLRSSDYTCRNINRTTWSMSPSEKPHSIWGPKASPGFNFFSPPKMSAFRFKPRRPRPTTSGGARSYTPELYAAESTGSRVEIVGNSRLWNKSCYTNRQSPSRSPMQSPPVTSIQSLGGFFSFGVPRVRFLNLPSLQGFK